MIEENPAGFKAGSQNVLPNLNDFSVAQAFTPGE